ncbi:hypothetical protein [uncultured Winogradskyella sp.]|uniref:Ig-like domain-containing protein n=1 Tax=uncultured Winogradskyella sp. TaxID=395353 RepID=UPI002629EE12|nr:hypothetical protein [uncultured Winogradskyella sp.]
MKKLTILLTLLIFFGCSKDDSRADENPDNQLDPEVAENVVIILDDKSNLTSSESDLNSGIYNIDFTSEVPEINTNDIIVGDEGEGFLRKVISVSSNGNSLSMQTTQATIDDVFNNVNIQFNTDISESSRMANPVTQKTQVNYIRKGVSFYKNGLGYNFSNTVLYDDGNATFTITNGNATFDPNFSFNADYSFFGGLDFLEFKADNANLEINCDFDVTVAGSLSLPEFSETLLDYDKYLTFLVAGVPVVVVINTQLVAELNASIDTNVTWLSSWTNTFGVTTGVKYENDNWTGNFDLTSDLELNSMDFGGQVNIAQNLTITPRASLKFYGVIGPYCQPELTEDFNFNVASPSLDWDAELKAGLNLTTGVDITIFGNTLADFSSTDSYEEPIWNAPTSLTIESGNNQTADQGQILDEPLKVKVIDALDNPMPFVPVYFSVTAGGGSLDEESVITDENGFAQVFWTLGDNTDSQTVEVTVKKADGTNIESITTFSANSEENEFEFTGSYSGETTDFVGNCSNSDNAGDWAFTFIVNDNNTITFTSTAHSLLNEMTTYSFSNNNLSFSIDIDYGGVQDCEDPNNGGDWIATLSFNGVYNPDNDLFDGTWSVNNIFSPQFPACDITNYSCQQSMIIN